MSHATSQVLVNAQDDTDTVVLPNACPGALVQMDDDSGPLRCFSILTKQPHTVPPECWSLVNSPDPMPPISGQDAVIADQFLMDHVTRGIVGDNALQLKFDEDGALRSIRLLPSGSGPAQAQWQAQAKMMLEE